MLEERPAPPSRGDAPALAAALARAGIPARVEAQERLALIGAADWAADGRRRADALRLARAAGFTHVALLVDPASPEREGTARGDADDPGAAPRAAGGRDPR